VPTQSRGLNRIRNVPSPGFYRKEAQRCRALATAGRDTQAAVRWLQMAKDCDILASQMDAEEPKLSGIPPNGPTHEQPLQQQQYRMKKPPER